MKDHRGDVLEQGLLFGEDEAFHVAWQEWQGMPEFVQDDLEPVTSVVVQFATQRDAVAFGDLIGQRFDPTLTRSYIWFPPQKAGRFKDKRYRGSE